MKTRIAIVGASGYTGVELIRLLLGHPQVEITCVTSRQYAGRSITEVFPSLAGRCELICSPMEVAAIAGLAEVAFTAVPHKTAMDIVPQLLEAGLKVIDLSADYRLRDLQVYQQWYQQHTSPQLLNEAVYGLPELYRDQVAATRLVANPGCYPTSVALALYPLLTQGLIDPATLIIDSKSGTSGAGRGEKLGSLYCEVNEGFKAYGVGNHRHTPEIEQTLSQVAGQPVRVSFTPHLLPVNRGILSTCYATLKQTQSTAELLELYQQIYADEAFVRVCKDGILPNIAYVKGTNFCDVGVVSDQRTGRVIVVAAIDNLVKGAAGQAVQNLNLMQGWTETTGLLEVAAFP
jgi:N-acetyl-gamma-glutamyl-phosphate reductase